MIHTLLIGDVEDALATIPDESVNCVITSPPYWGLRDYGAAGQIGQEPTPQEYVDNLTRVFREVRRVLRKDGVCWLNMGDSYAGSRTSSLKPKDLVGIPWMTAFALRDDGWHLRAENIWEKPNKMPESARDRTTRSHEQVFLLTKSSSTLFWTHPRKQGSRRHPKPDHVWTHKRTGLTVDYPPVSARLLREFWTKRNLWEGHDYYYDAEAIKEPLAEHSDVAYRSKIRKGKQYDSKEPYRLNFPASFDLTGKNRRSVWHINTAKFKGAHFAVFPPALARICLLGGCPKQVCPVCGAPWERTVEKIGSYKDDPEYRQHESQQWNVGSGGNHCGHGAHLPMVQRRQVGWAPTCACPGNDGSGHGTVLDPFGGAGTVSLVAEQEGRDSIYIDLKPEYGMMTHDRIMAAHGSTASVFAKVIEHEQRQGATA